MKASRIKSNFFITIFRFALLNRNGLPDAFMSSTTYISIDVAVRSLAIGVYRLKPFVAIDTYKDSNPETMDTKLNSIIVPIRMQVVDINHGEKTKETSVVEKAVALKTILQQLDDEIHEEIMNDHVCVLVEYQLPSNHGANAIFNMLVMHYATNYPIHVMKPAWKNTISLHPLLSHSAFLGHCSSNYAANKQHTKHNMLYFLTMIDRMDMIHGIAKRNLDDIADTLMQCLAHHKKISKE